MKRKAIINHINGQLDDIDDYLGRPSLSNEMQCELFGERCAYSDVLGLLEEPKEPKAPKAPKAPKGLTLTADQARVLYEFILQQDSEARLTYGGYATERNRSFYRAWEALDDIEVAD